MANLTIKQIEDYVGKEVAEKIQNEEGKVWDGDVVKKNGYDDGYFHTVVIPDMKCDKCGKSVSANESELNEEYRPLTTKYPDGFQV